MWLIDQTTFHAMQRAHSAGLTPTAKQAEEFEARFDGEGGSGSRILTTAGATAEISVRGVLTNKPDFIAWLVGGGNTTYGDLIEAIAQAEQDDDIEEIVYRFDTPGGDVSGLFNALAAMEAAVKPSRGIVENLAASAGYALASKAGPLAASNAATRVGSIGIMVRGFVDPEVVTVTSTKAPKKAPDLGTEEGRAIVREELDAMHDLFVETIAAGRGVSVDTVNTNFGQGAVLVAAEALSNGMIDSIVGQANLSVVPSRPAATSKNSPEEASTKMDYETLKAKHPEVFAKVAQEGEQRGAATERERVSAFLVAGEQSGDMKKAMTAIKEGTEMTASLSMEFVMAAANRGDRSRRSDDDDEAGGAADGANGAETEEERDAKASAALTAACFDHMGLEQRAEA